MLKKINRRKFIKTTVIAGTAATVIPKSLFSFQARKRVKIGIIGTGMRGQWILWLAAKYPEVDIPAICDIDEGMVASALKILKDAGKPKPRVYKKGDEDFLNMVKNEDLDGVYIATPWEWHHSMAIAAMKQGIHVGTEVPAALTVKDCWDLVNTSERTGKHCMIMENVCYRRDVLAVLNMVRQGLFGELLHCQGGYQHDLRHVKFNDGKQPYGGGVKFGEHGYSEAKWRTQHSVDRNGDLYPTHGLGPVAQYMNLARNEDNFKHLVSLSSPAIGRNKFAKENFDSDHKWNKMDFSNGDMNTSIIKTNLGRTVMVQWDETSPRPYSRLNLIQGTKGTLAGFPTRAAFENGFEGITKDHHSWIQGDKLEKLYEKYDHPLYKRLNSKTKKSGHGGMDGIMMYRIVECLKNGLPLDQNVYEGCFWSAVTPLSASSIENDGSPQAFPDFTRGDWKKTKELEIVV